MLFNICTLQLKQHKQMFFGIVQIALFTLLYAYEVCILVNEALRIFTIKGFEKKTKLYLA